VQPQLPTHYPTFWRNYLALRQSGGAWEEVLQTLALHLRRKDKKIICERLDVSAFDESRVKDQVDTILIHSDGSLQIEQQNAEYFELLPN